MLLLTSERTEGRQSRPASLERLLTRPHSRLVMGLKQPCLKFIFKSFLIFHFRKCDVLNRGFSGYNTRWAKIILPRLIRKGNILDSPVAVTIFFGANDSALKGKGVWVFSQFIFHVTANLHVCSGSRSPERGRSVQSVTSCPRPEVCFFCHQCR